MAIRVTKLEDSGMIARKISDFRVHVCATPEFLERYPNLEHPTDISNVPFIVDTNSRTQASVRFYNPDSTSFAVAVSGPIEVNSPHATLRAALSGIGIAVIPDFIARKPIEDGRLVTLFNDYIPTDRGIYAVYPHRRYLPAKVRIFVDYLHMLGSRSRLEAGLISLCHLEAGPNSVPFCRQEDIQSVFRAEAVTRHMKTIHLPDDRA